MGMKARSKARATARRSALWLLTSVHPPRDYDSPSRHCDPRPWPLNEFNTIPNQTRRSAKVKGRQSAALNVSTSSYGGELTGFARCGREVEVR